MKRGEENPAFASVVENTLQNLVDVFVQVRRAEIVVRALLGHRVLDFYVEAQRHWHLAQDRLKSRKRVRQKQHVGLMVCCEAENKQVRKKFKKERQDSYFLSSSRTLDVTTAPGSEFARGRDSASELFSA